MNDDSYQSGVALETACIMWKRGILCLEGRCEFRNMALMILLLPNIACKTDIEKCAIGNPLPIRHRYFQPGDLIIGGITSQFLLLLNVTDFKQHPHESEIYEDL